MATSENDIFANASDDSDDDDGGQQVGPFSKITLRETEDIDLFQSNSFTVPRESEEAAVVEAQNEAYDYLTIGKGRQRRTGEAETQTTNFLYKSRSVNTDLVKKNSVGTFVSNYDMFDTYADLERNTQSINSLDKRNKIELTTYKTGGGGGGGDGTNSFDENLS